MELNYKRSYWEWYLVENMSCSKHEPSSSSDSESDEVDDSAVSSREKRQVNW